MNSVFSHEPSDKVLWMFKLVLRKNLQIALQQSIQPPTHPTPAKPPVTTCQTCKPIALNPNQAPTNIFVGLHRKTPARPVQEARLEEKSRLGFGQCEKMANNNCEALRRGLFASLARSHRRRRMCIYTQACSPRVDKSLSLSHSFHLSFVPSALWLGRPKARRVGTHLVA